MAELSEQKVIVTGAARGIGRAIAEKFGRAGADVGLLDLDPNVLEETASELAAETGADFTPLAADVTEPPAVEAVFSDWLDEKGAIHTLVNNAGITKDGLMLRQKKSDWDDVLDVNLSGSYNCVQAALKPMMKERWGRIVMVSSVIGLQGNAGQTNYAASKAGLIGLTKSVARELAGRNITCNAVAPGFIRTEMTEQLPDEQQEEIREITPLERFGEPEEVADCILFLAGENSAFITGEVIRIDGGLAM